MLELRPSCECCDRDLPPDSREARICTYECTWCADCASRCLAGECANCGGDLQPRPVRPASRLAEHPATSTRTVASGIHRARTPQRGATVVRDATEDDLPAITAIYNDAVLHTTAIWNDTPVDVHDRLAWLTARREQGYPVLVAIDGADVVGYASYGAWRPFAGYRHTVEHSVYVRGDQRGKGVGQDLLLDLVDRARAAGLHAMVAGVAADNAASTRLHERLGFRPVGLLPEVGAKFDRWLDLAFLQLTLDDRSRP